MLPSSPLLLKSERVASGVLEDNAEDDITPRKRRNSEDGSSSTPNPTNSPHVLSRMQSFVGAAVSDTPIPEDCVPEETPGDKRKDRRVENAWWRSWWIERKRIESGLQGEHPMFTDMFSQGALDAETEIDVELEGVPVTNHKIWEKYYSKFLSKISEEISVEPIAEPILRGTSVAAQNQTSVVTPQQEPITEMPNETKRSTVPSDPIPIPMPPLSIHESALTDKKTRGQGFFAGMFGKGGPSNAPGSALAALCAQPEAAGLVQMFSQPATPPTESFIPVPAEVEGMDVVMLRKYFTEFHNSDRYGGDNVSPYLGEDPSVHSSNAFAFANFTAGTFKRSSSSLLALQEAQPFQAAQLVTLPDTSPVLIQFPGKDADASSATGPAAANAMKVWIFISLFSSAPNVLINTLWGCPVIEAESCNPSSIPANVPVLLGPVQLKLDQMHVWSTRWLVLYDNFLLEFSSAEIRGRPFGYCALSGGAFVEEAAEETKVRAESKAYSNSAEDSSVLVLRCMKECHARSPIMKVYIRLNHDVRGSNIRSLLRRACRLGIEDLYSIKTRINPQASSGSGQDNYDQQSVLGKGRFTEVHKASKKHVSTDMESSCLDDPTCALKLVNKQSFWERVRQGKERADTLIREVLTQAVISVNNRDVDIPVVRLRGVFETLEYFVLELELMQSTDLFDRLSTMGVMSEVQAKSVCRQLIQAVQLCSRHNIAHRDIKLSNVVFPIQSSMTGNEDYIFVKLADFGMAGFIGEDGLLRGRCGTPGYVAPEILRAWQQEGYSPNVDMFSVGVVTYTLMCGYEPFYGTTDKQLIQANKMAEYEFHMPEWSRISEQARDFVARLLVSNGNERMTYSEALQHPWLASVNEPVMQQAISDTCTVS